MIALDLDGTALLPDHLTMSSGVQNALRKAYEKGIYVVPVTGRPYRLLPDCIGNHPGWESYGVLCNGADVRNFKTGETLSHWNLDPDALKKVLEIAVRYDIPVEFNSDGSLYLTNYSYKKEILDPRMQFHCTDFIPKHGFLVDCLQNCCNRKVEKVHLNCIPETVLPSVTEELSRLPICVVSEKPNNLEVTHPEATKGKALKVLCSRLKVPMEKVMAIGDSGNDISMLEAVGLPVAMGTAPDFIKAIAGYVTSGNMEDGAAQAINHFIE